MAKSVHATVRHTLERMGTPFREIVGGFEDAHEPTILDGAMAATATAITTSPVIAHGPLNETLTSMVEPNGEDGGTELEGLGQERCKCLSFCFH